MLKNIDFDLSQIGLKYEILGIRPLIPVQVF